VTAVFEAIEQAVGRSNTPDVLLTALRRELGLG
jgi:hypothetical protein